jgi:hypothetical protein
LLKALVNQTESDITSFASKLKGTSWQLPPEFETDVMEHLQQKHINPTNDPFN